MSAVATATAAAAVVAAGGMFSSSGENTFSRDLFIHEALNVRRVGMSAVAAATAGTVTFFGKTPFM